MFVKRTMVAWASAIVLGVTLSASGGSGSGGSGGGTIGAGTTGSEITLRIPNEMAPAGGMVQMKVLSTEVTPISGGRPGFGFDGSMFAVPPASACSRLAISPARPSSMVSTWRCRTRRMVR